MTTAGPAAPLPGRKSLRQQAARSFRRYWQLYLLMLIPIAYFVIFKYIPMGNAVIAFKAYNPVDGGATPTAAALLGLRLAVGIRRARLEQANRDIEDNLLIGVDNARRTLEAGFTTIRDLGSEVRSVTALRDAINSGLVQGPTIVAAILFLI